MDGAIPAWRRALHRLPAVGNGHWAVGGSASLALHGLPIDPRDVDVLADEQAVGELIDGLGDTVVLDQTPWDRGDVRAERRVLAVVEGVELEILVGVEAVGGDGRVVLTTPNLDLVELPVLDGKAVPVLSLATMQAVLEATGRRERAALVREAISHRDLVSPDSECRTGANVTIDDGEGPS